MLMIISRVAVIDEEERCFIGLRPLASVTLILYDIFISSWLTFLFIKPLMSANSVLQGPSKGRLRQVARRTLIGSIVALILSSLNVFTLVYYRGYEDSILCLLSCTLDVTLNAVTVHWVTSRTRGSPPPEKPNRALIHRAPSPSISSSTVNEKQSIPSDTHISVTVQSYQDEY